MPTRNRGITLKVASRRRRSQLGMMNTATTAMARIAERDTDMGRATPMLAAASQRRTFSFAGAANARLIARGSSIASTTPNSIGWLAVPVIRRNIDRAEMRSRVPFTRRPGMWM